MLKKTLLASVVMLGSLVAAHAGVYGNPISGTFDMLIWQGTGNGSSTNSIEQANLSNPLLKTAPAAQLTYTGALRAFPA